VSGEAHRVTAAGSAANHLPTRFPSAQGLSG